MGTENVRHALHSRDTRESLLDSGLSGRGTLCEVQTWLGKEDDLKCRQHKQRLMQTCQLFTVERRKHVESVDSYRAPGEENKKRKHN